VNYCTPDLLRLVLDDVAERTAANDGAAPDGLCLNAVRNGKDFGFRLRKPAS